METSAISNFQKMVDVNLPIIYIQDFDFARVDAFIREAVGEDANISEWNPGTGVTDFDNRTSVGNGRSVALEEFLYNIYRQEAFIEGAKIEGFVVLKEIQDLIDIPSVKSLLELIAQRKLYDRSFEKAIIIVSSELKVPSELKHYVSYLDLGFPSEKEIEELINEHIETNGYERKEDLKELKQALKGMSRYDIDRMLDMAMSTNGSLGKEDQGMILTQKKRMVRNSGLLDLIETDNGNNDDGKDAMSGVGGLDTLKAYLNEKSKIIKDATKAMEYGVSMPKGIFLVGMPGCGKSLSAKAAAKLFNVPLLKMDMGSLMGKYVGESELHLRQAIRIAEAAAPCILWIDEIEKGFSGIGGRDDVMTRMFGHFLSWMQDKTSTVYVIATANDASNLPPELKRKGRFDEVFCINLPNAEERKAIFKVHTDKVNRRHKGSPLFKLSDDDFTQLANATNGFNGADIESVVNEATEKGFANNKKDKIKAIDLLSVVKDTVSISKSCKPQIEAMKRVFAESNFKDATKQ